MTERTLQERLYSRAADIDRIDSDCFTTSLMREAASALDAAEARIRELEGALVTAWDDGAEAAFEADGSGEDSNQAGLYGRELDEFYARNPYRNADSARKEGCSYCETTGRCAYCSGTGEAVVHGSPARKGDEDADG